MSTCRRTELAMAGKTRAEMKRAIDADFAVGSNPAGSPGPFIFEREGGPYSSVVVVVPDFIEVSMPSAARGG